MVTVLFKIMLAPRNCVRCCSTAGKWSDNAIIMRVNDFTNDGVTSTLRVAQKSFSLSKN